MPESDARVMDLLRENEELRARLADAEEHVRAFRAGEVDAVVVYEDEAQRIYTLQGADHSYRVMVEQMNEAAVVLGKDLTVLFANANLAKLVGEAPEDVLGSSFERFVPDDTRRAFRSLLDRTREGGCTGELSLLAKGRRIPVYLSLAPVELGDVHAACLLITDLTEQKRSEQMLAEGRLASAILEQQAEATVICGPDGRILRASQVTERLCGRDPIGEVLESVLPLEMADGSRFWMGTLRPGEPLQGAHVQLRREGATARDLLLSATVLTGSSDVMLGWVLSFVDISERKRAENALQVSESRLRSFLENSTVVAWLKDAGGRYIFLSQNYERRFGVRLEDWNGKTDLELWPRDIAEEFMKNDLAVLAANKPIEVTERARNADGTVSWWLNNKFSFSDPSGGRYVGGLGVDITERREAEKALRESEALYRGIGESIDFGVWVCSPTGENIYASRSFLDMVGITQEQCSKFGWGDALHPDDAERTITAWKECVRTGGKWDIEHRFRGVDGQWHHVLARGVPIKDEQGEITCWAGINLDITPLKVVEEELREARVAADAAARAKAEFLANMSHEIRTPMNAVIGFTDLLLGTPLDADQRRFLNLIKNSGEALLDVVNDVLDLSKMEAGKFDFVEEAFDLRDLTEKVTRSLGLRAHQRRLELTSHVPFSVPTALVGDPARLRQVLVNLLGNAIKFTDHGDVHLSVGLADAEGGKRGCPEAGTRDETVGAEPPGFPASQLPSSTVKLRFTVRDTGIGIPQERLGLLFQSFQQLDSSSTRRHEGTGLGLFISRRIVEQMGGRIEVESEEGVGSTFSFTVPFRLQPGAPVCATEVVELRGHRVLVVDDNATNRMIVLEMLTTQGMAVALANGGEEALGLLRAAEAAGQPCELLLVDCQMPRMDGFQLIERIKGDSRFPQPAIVMITSDDLPRYGARARAAGAAAYLVKPVVCAELLSAVRSVLVGAGVREDGPTEKKEPTGEAGRPLRLLLAEDNTVNQILVRALVEREGWSIDVAEDGRSALAALSGEQEYDLVLMDVQMPVLDGYKATRSLRDLEKCGKKARRTPVIGLTAHALPGDRQRCLDAGMDDYLTKPLEAQALGEMVRRHVQVGERRGPPAEINATLRDNPALLRRLTKTFLEDYPGKLAALRQAVERRTVGEIESAAHGLLGSLLVFGARRAAECARRLQACAQQGRVEDAPVLCESLEHEVRRLAAHLAELAQIRG